MAVTAREAFKLGFTQALLEKRADPLGITDGIGKVLTGIKDMGITGIVGAAGLGAGTGVALAKAQDPGITSDEVRKQDLIGEYRRLAAAARRRMRAKVLQGGTLP